MNKVNPTILTKLFCKKKNKKHDSYVLPVFSHLFLQEDLGLLIGRHIILLELGFPMFSTCMLNEGMNEWADLGPFVTAWLWWKVCDVVSHKWVESYLVTYTVHLESPGTNNFHETTLDLYWRIMPRFKVWPSKWLLPRQESRLFLNCYFKVNFNSD